MKRFRVLDATDAAKHFPDDDCDEGDRYRRYLVEFTDDDKPARIVGSDGGEPEDQTFGRDWNWVCGELNRLADEIRSIRAHG